jgi:hypothetical protein
MQTFTAKKKLTSAAGFSLLDVVFAMGLGAFVMAALAGVLFLSAKEQVRDNQKVSAVAARNYVYRNLTQWQSLRATLVGNAATFACALNNTGCPGTVNTANFAIYEPGNSTPIYNATTSPKVGFDENGVPCTPAGGLDAPTRDCPVRVDFEWQALCTSGCVDPVPISITAKIIVHDAALSTATVSKSFNAGYDFVLLKSVHSRTCLTPWGVRVNDGASVTAYSRTTAPCGSPYVVSRTCTDTQLDDQYDYVYGSCL